MKSFYLMLLLLSLCAVLVAETNPISEYYTNPTPTSYIAAMQYCNDALQKDTSQHNLKIQMASLALMESNRLIDELTPVLDSLNVGGMFQYANLMLAREKYQDAVDVYQKINDSTPDWSCPWRHKGEALYRQHKLKEALVSFQKAVDTNKEHYDAYVWLAKTQYQLKKYKAALGNLETALTLNPEAEESPDEVIPEDSIKALHEALLKKTGKRK